MANGSALWDGFEPHKIWINREKSAKACPEEKTRKSETINRKTPVHGPGFNNGDGTPGSMVPMSFFRRERRKPGPFTSTNPPFWSFHLADGCGKGKNLDYLAPVGAHKLKKKGE